jgi:microcystin-dependent protein
MATPFIGEIRMFGGNFAPAGWAFCDGSVIPISEYEALFNLIGTTYGGDGQSTFALPDLRGRVPVHMGQGPGLSPYVIGQMAGVEAVTLGTSQVPAHTHVLTASSVGATAGTPINNVTAAAAAGTTTKMYADASASPTNMASAAVSHVGDGFPHENRMPYLAVSFIISLFGIFPSQA